MKDTGVVRKLDELGRITLPMEIRKSFKIKERDPLHIYIDNGRIVLQKAVPSCIFTGEEDDRQLVEYNGKKVAVGAIKELAELAGFTVTEDNGAK